MDEPVDTASADSFAGVEAPDTPPPDLRAAAAAAAMTRSRSDPHTVSLPGVEPEQIGHYRILQRIGEGGMGVVYLAEQRHPIRRNVALKVIKPGMDSREVIARFEAERQALAIMSHPNVAKIFEAGITESGRPFFAMEHVSGTPLTQYCDENKLTTRHRLELFVLVCHAVQHAHQKGIIHRDLKPSNLLVTMVDDKPVVKVIDFGIAKATNQEFTQRTLFTHTGSMVGTPEYMSPEQAQGGGLEIDTRTDIYSLGVILYELLTGVTPFDAKTLRSAGLDQIAKMIREVEPPRPSTRLSAIPSADPAAAPATPASSNPPRTSIDVAKCRGTDLRTLRREVSGDLDWIVLKAIAKDRTRRYETATGFASDVRRFLDGERVEARQESIAYRVKCSWRRFSRDRVKTVLTAIVVCLAAVLILTSMKLMSARPPVGSVAVLPLQAEAGSGEDGEYLGDLATDSLIRSLSGIPSLKVMSRSAVMRFKGSDIQLQRAGKELGVEAVLGGRVVTRDKHLVVSLELVDPSDGRRLWAAEYPREAYDTPAAQAEISKAVGGALRPSGLRVEGQAPSRGTADAEAYQLYLKGRFFWNKISEEGYRKGIEFFEKAIQRDPNYALAYCGLADCYVGLGVDFQAPHQAYAKAREYALKALQLEPSLPDAHVSMGTIYYYYDWNWLEAQRELHQAMAADPKVAETNLCYVHSLDSLGQTDQAVQYVQEALSHNPLSVSLCGEVGCASYYAGKFDQAIARSREALEMDPGFAMARWNLARSHGQRGEFDDALAELKKAREALESWPGFSAEMAYAFARTGRKAEAKALLGELEARAQRVYVDPIWLAVMQVGLGNNERALAMLEKGFEMRSSSVPFLSAEPKFIPIRADPRFQSLLSRAGLRP